MNITAQVDPSVKVSNFIIRAGVETHGFSNIRFTYRSFKMFEVFLTIVLVSLHLAQILRRMKNYIF